MELLTTCPLWLNSTLNLSGNWTGGDGNRQKKRRRKKKHNVRLADVHLCRDFFRGNGRTRGDELLHAGDAKRAAGIYANARLFGLREQGRCSNGTTLHLKP